MSAGAIVAVIVLGLIGAALIAVVVCIVIAEVTERYRDWQDRRRQELEAELDRKAARLRRAVLELADQLAADRDAASRELTRAAFLARTDRLE